MGKGATIKNSNNANRTSTTTGCTWIHLESATTEDDPSRLRLASSSGSLAIFAANRRAKGLEKGRPSASGPKFKGECMKKTNGPRHKGRHDYSEAI
jgi:hypothetical protein